MIFHIVKKLIYTFPLFLFISCNGYIFYIDFYENNKLICFGDVHKGMNDKFKHDTLSNEQLLKIHKQQAKDIIKFIKNYKKEDCLVILEDYYDFKNEKYKEIFARARYDSLKNNHSSIFDFLNEFCIKNNIPFVNSEYRQTFLLCFIYFQIPIEEFLIDFENIIKEINGYNDGQYLNNYYKKNLDNLLTKHKSFINLIFKNPKKFANEIINKNNEEEKTNFFADYIYLLDLRILHIIHNNRDKNIFLCAGVNHPYRLQTVFKEMGYKQIKNKENNESDPININKVLKSLFPKEQFVSIGTTNSIFNKFILIIVILADLLIKSGYIFIRRRQMQRNY